jgi:hypothetical protein
LNTIDFSQLTIRTLALKRAALSFSKYARTGLALGGALLVVTSCGGDAKRNDTPAAQNPDVLPVDEVPLANFGAAWVKESCQLLEECLPIFDFERVPGGCQAFHAKSAADHVATLQRSIDLGRVTYDAEKMAACLENDGWSCDGGGSIECTEAILGKVAAGEPCDTNTECQPSLRCGGTCPATCFLPSAAGEACDSAGQCARGLYCTGSGVCTPRVADGEPCQIGMENPCHGTAQCQPTNDGTGSICTPIALVGEGEECGREPWRACAPGLACVRKSERDPEVCVLRAEPGGDCWVGEEDSCPVGQWCSTASGDPNPIGPGKCLPQAKRGQPCTDQAFSCEADSRCVENVCVAPQNLDEDCTDDRQCTTDTCNNGKCAWPELCEDE